MMNPPCLLSVEHCRYGIRETTEGTAQLIPELCLVGHVRYHTARPASFFNHRHAHVLEIFYVAHGKVTWWVEGVSTDVCGNELFFIWPGEWHGARDNIVEPAEYYWVQVRLPLLRQSAGAAFFAHGTPDRRMFPGRKLVGTKALLPLYQALLNEHACREPCGETVVRETLHLLLSLVLRCSQTQKTLPRVDGAHQARIARAIHWTKRNVADATLQGMADASALDATTFRKRFCEVVGFSPSQYLTRLRLQRAKEWMARGANVTEIAHGLGFSSSQYFATVFRKYEGFTPSEFRRRGPKT